MKKKLSVFYIITLLVFCLFTPAAQESAEETAVAEESGPEDPDMVLPSVILEVKDLSVEKVDAGLPVESEILIPERTLSLPDEVALEIEEPSFFVDLPDIEAADSAAGEALPVIVEAMLGGGNINMMVGRISMYKSGQAPRFKFLFNHETQDGYGQNLPGQGYNFRNDEVTGSLMFNLGDVDMETQVSFIDEEAGLQGQGDYYSVINRFMGFDLKSKIPLGGNMTLDGGAESDFTFFILTGKDFPSYTPSVTNPPTELYVSPYLTGQFLFDSFTLGVTADYSYRSVLGAADYDLHRGHFKGDFNIEFPFWLGLSGNAGYFTSSVHSMLFPFELAFSGTPTEIFSFGLRGGYFLKENNLKELLADISFLDFPSAFVDNHGWFAALDLNFNLFNNLIDLHSGTEFHMNSIYYKRGSQGSNSTGLFTLDSVSSVPGLKFSGDIDFNFTEIFSLHFSGESLLLYDSLITYDNSFLVRADLSNSAGTLGGSLGAQFTAASDLVMQLPVLNLNGFYQVTDNIKISLDLEDLLYPALEGQRYLTAPFIEPGIKGLLKVEINF